MVSKEEALSRLRVKHNNTIKLLGTYTGTSKKYTFRCRCKHTWVTTLDSIVNGGRGCPICSRIKGGIKRSLYRKGNTYKKSVRYNCVIIYLLSITGDLVGKALIDKEDYSRCKQHTWGFDRGYVTSRSGGLLHRFIMNCPKNKVVDHKFHNTLDNRKSKLRICTKHQNICNKTGSSIGYKGVYKTNNTWQSSITTNNKNIYLGIFKTDTLAAIAYNEAALKYHGEFAKLNII